MEQFVGDTCRLKISSEKAVKRTQLGTEVFWIHGHESKQATDDLDLDLDLLYMYGAHNY